MAKGKGRKRVCPSYNLSKNGKERKIVSCPSSDLLSSSWACLPDDLLNSILDRLDPCDYIRLSVVCKSWNLISLRHRKENRIRNSNHQLPWLLKRTCHGHQKLFNYATGAEVSCRLSFPHQYKRLLRCDCSHGRLIFFMEHKCQLVVLDPFSACGGGTDVIRLPPFKNSFFKYVDKVILSRDPSPGSNFEVVATCRYSDVVAHLLYVDDDDHHQLNWTYSEKTRDYYTYNFAFYKDRILGVSPEGRVVSLNVINSSKEKDSSSSSPPRISIEEISSSIEWMSYSDSFIVETTNGELLMVGRSSKFYKIFKIMDSSGRLDLSQVVDLGGHSLFLEKHHSLSVMASNYPGSCRPNTIYYVGTGGLQYYGTFEEFNLEDQSLHVDFERFPMSEGSWIVPSMKP